MLRSDFSETDWHILLTLLTLIVSAGTAVAGLSVAERGHVAIGWGAVTVAVLAFVVIAAATWDGFDADGLGKLAGTAAFAVIATLLGTTQLILHRGRHGWVVRITWAAGLLALALSTSALWAESSGDTWKVGASFWIIAAVGWLNLPVLQRFSAAGAPATGERVLAELHGVELVLTRSSYGLVVELAPGERLALRKLPRS